MCEPATIALIAAGVSLAGTGVSAYGQVQAGKNANATAKFNAEMQNRAAHDAEVRGSLDAADKRQETRQLIARQIAALSGTGADLTSGTALDLMTESAGMGALDALRIRYNAQNQAAGLNAQADIGRFEGRAAQRAGYMNAAGTLLSGASSAATGYYGMKSAAKTPKWGANGGVQ
jgi:hypothetical protein